MSGRPRLATLACATFLAAATLIPFASGLWQGRSFYFRDLGLFFFPLRRFALEGLRQGELRYWNPYVHEGIPAPHPPLSYPLDLLQLFASGEAGLSLTLALHIPLSALTLFLLARAMGATRTAAAGGGLVYALGGFALSCLNLYVYTQALAWAPAMVWALRRAADGDRRRIALAAALCALTTSTLAIEVVVQAALVALVLGLHGAGVIRRAARMAVALALGAMLAAPTVLVTGATTALGDRGAGLASDVVLAHSVHPLTFVQVLIGDWHGKLADVVNWWWGSNFFVRGFPYILSLYLGTPVIALAVAGFRRADRESRALAALAAAAAVVCLGRWVGLTAVVESLPAALKVVRFPVKAFFTIHLCIALLGARALTLLQQGQRGAWRRMAILAGGLGLALVTLPLLSWLLPGASRSFLAGFLPPAYDWATREAVGRDILADAARGGLLALTVAGSSLGFLVGRVRAPAGAGLIVALVGVDLLRTGAGLNPMVTSSFFQPSAELATHLPSLRAGGRVFTCYPESSPAYWQARRRRPHAHEVWTFSTRIETLTPYANVAFQVSTALSEDLTSLVPLDRLPPAGATCRRFDDLASRLRSAAVAHVISLDPLGDGSLTESWRESPSHIRPLTIYAYAIASPEPRVSVLPESAGNGRDDRRPHLWTTERAGQIEVVVDARQPSVLVVREGHAPGWKAWLDAVPAALLVEEGRYLGVRVPAGRHVVRLRYRPPGLVPGCLIAGAAAAATFILGMRRTHPVSPGHVPSAALGTAPPHEE